MYGKIRSAFLGSLAISGRISATGRATPLVSSSSNVKPRPYITDPLKLLPSFALSLAGSSWPPAWKRYAVMSGTGRRSRSYGGSNEVRDVVGPAARGDVFPTWTTLPTTAAWPGHLN